jgi:hypothetical protein
MPDREPTAAEALFGHLPKAEPAERPQRNGSIAAAMFPSQPAQPKPKPPEHPLLPRLKRFGES